jgi:hypothetical protein
MFNTAYLVKLNLDIIKFKIISIYHTILCVNLVDPPTKDVLDLPSIKTHRTTDVVGWGSQPINLLILVPIYPRTAATLWNTNQPKLVY